MLIQTLFFFFLLATVKSQTPISISAADCKPEDDQLNGICQAFGEGELSDLAVGSFVDYSVDISAFTDTEESATGIDIQTQSFTTDGPSSGGITIFGKLGSIPTEDKEADDEYFVECEDSPFCDFYKCEPESGIWYFRIRNNMNTTFTSSKIEAELAKEHTWCSFGDALQGIAIIIMIVVIVIIILVCAIIGFIIWCCCFKG